MGKKAMRVIRRYVHIYIERRRNELFAIKLVKHCNIRDLVHVPF